MPAGGQEELLVEESRRGGGQGQGYEEQLGPLDRPAQVAFHAVEVGREDELRAQ